MVVRTRTDRVIGANITWIKFVHEVVPEVARYVFFLWWLLIGPCLLEPSCSTFDNSVKIEMVVV